MSSIQQSTGLNQLQQFQVIAQAANAHGIDPKILGGIYGIETSFGQNVSTSSAGAEGPFQFIPSTAQSYNYPLTNTPSVQQFTQQANAAAQYLSSLIKSSKGDTNAAVQAYSGGGYGLAEVQSQWNGLPNTLKNALAGLGTGPLAGPFGQSGTVNQIASGLKNTLTAGAAFASDITNPQWWLHVLEVIAGAVVLILGLRSLGGSSTRQNIRVVTAQGKRVGGALGSIGS